MIDDFLVWVERTAFKLRMRRLWKQLGNKGKPQFFFGPYPNFYMENNDDRD